MRSHSRIQQSGVTLIELMIAIALLAIIAALAAPAFRDAMERASIKGATDDVVSFVNSARQTSVKLDRDINLTLRGTGTSWCVGARAAADPTPGVAVGAAAECDCIGNASLCTVDGAVSVLNSANLSSIGGPPSIDAADIAAIFDRKLGTLQDFTQAGNVVLTSSSGKYVVRIDLLVLGQARACIPGGAGSFGGFRPC